MRWNLKEAECKLLARRTGSAYEALQKDETANNVKVQSLYGILRRKCDGYKQESYKSYLGRSHSYLPEVRESARGEKRRCETKLNNEKSAEAIVGFATKTEGLNLKSKGTRSLPTNVEAEAEKRAERLEAYRGEEARKAGGNL